MEASTTFAAADLSVAIRRGALASDGLPALTWAITMQRSPRNIDTIIAEQIHRWEIERKARAKEQEPVEPWPLVTISREFGSQGAAVGERVAKRLGFRFWDQELVHAVSTRTGAKQNLVDALDERHRGKLDDFVTHLVVGVEATAAEYVSQVGRVIHTLHQHGAAVVVGRGSQFILPAADTLRVRVVCPRPIRIEGYAARQAIATRDADRKLREVDRERVAYYQRHFKQDVTDATHYDIVVNTGYLALDDCVELVVTAYELKFGELPDVEEG